MMGGETAGEITAGPTENKEITMSRNTGPQDPFDPNNDGGGSGGTWGPARDVATDYDPNRDPRLTKTPKELADENANAQKQAKEQARIANQNRVRAHVAQVAKNKLNAGKAGAPPPPPAPPPKPNPPAPGVPPMVTPPTGGGRRGSGLINAFLEMQLIKSLLTPSQPPPAPTPAPAPDLQAKVNDLEVEIVNLKNEIAALKGK